MYVTFCPSTASSPSAGCVATAYVSNASSPSGSTPESVIVSGSSSLTATSCEVATGKIFGTTISTVTAISSPWSTLSNAANPIVSTVVSVAAGVYVAVAPLMTTSPVRGSVVNTNVTESPSSSSATKLNVIGVAGSVISTLSGPAGSTVNAVGAVFTSAIVTVTVAASTLSTLPSLTMYVNWSSPTKPSVG